MSLATVLPVTSNKAQVSIPYSDFQYLVPAETGVYDHWIFDQGGAAGLTGVVNSRALTAVGTTTYNASSVNISTSTGEGLKSTYQEAALPADTVCAVLRVPSIAVVAAQAIFGNQDRNATPMNGMVAYYFQSSGSSTLLQYALNGTAPNPGGFYTNKFQPDQWLFVGVSRNVVASSADMIVLLGGQSESVYETTGGYNQATLEMMLGNTSADNGERIDAAEFIVFNSALTGAELQAVYQRSKVRMAARGIDLV